MNEERLTELVDAYNRHYRLNNSNHEPRLWQDHLSTLNPRCKELLEKYPGASYEEAVWVNIFFELKSRGPAFLEKYLETLNENIRKTLSEENEWVNAKVGQRYRIDIASSKVVLKNAAAVALSDGSASVSAWGTSFIIWVDDKTEIQSPWYNKNHIFASKWTTGLELGKMMVSPCSDISPNVKDWPRSAALAYLYSKFNDGYPVSLSVSDMVVAPFSKRETNRSYKSHQVARFIVPQKEDRETVSFYQKGTRFLGRLNHPEIYTVLQGSYYRILLLNKLESAFRILSSPLRNSIYPKSTRIKSKWGIALGQQPGMEKNVYHITKKLGERIIPDIIEASYIISTRLGRLTKKHLLACIMLNQYDRPIPVPEDVTKFITSLIRETSDRGFSNETPNFYGNRTGPLLEDAFIWV